jgi:predicted ATPase
MKLTRVDVRFYKSFNYDFELKARKNSERAPWEDSEGPWYPFVKIPLDERVTAVVGANESGKSQLLGAIKTALGVSPIHREDFCRYSEEYSVQVDRLRYPEFGAWLELEHDEPFVAITALASAKSFGLFRPGSNSPYLVINNQRVAMSDDDLTIVQSRLPGVFEMVTDLAIPDSVSIARLAGISETAFKRDQRSTLLDRIEGSDKTESVLGRIISTLLGERDAAAQAAAAGDQAEFDLARKLLIEAARIAPQSFAELKTGLTKGHEGHVEGLIGRMNAAIKENLNIQRWWTQDKDFDLLVEAREHEIALTIKDRTAATYSFKERSQGLRFFLSYFVQLTAHRLAGKGTDILLLDEPDAYLSSVGQQDLLRVLLDYAVPEDATPGGQVMYVTHSPFLVDKNTPQRIRVLDKGADEEGTRVVNDAANNRYEPLRSSLGEYIAETAFIGGQNLFVEGMGDQVLLAGMSAHVASREQSLQTVLDLNTVTIVGSGGADAVPYMVYLARGRDAFKPACVALLDGDKAGRQAEGLLKRGEIRNKRILADHYIVRLDAWATESGLETDWGTTPIEIEDLLPLAVARRAALNYLARFIDLTPATGHSFSLELIIEHVSASNNVWDGLSAAVQNVFPTEHLEKVGLAREVIKLMELSPDILGADELRRRFTLLLTALAERLQDAEDDESGERRNDKLARLIQGFISDHTKGMKKYDAQRLLRQLTLALPDSAQADTTRLRLQEIGREYELTDASHPAVPRFEDFRDNIAALGQLERLSYQDETKIDPSAAVSLTIEADVGESSTTAPINPIDEILDIPAGPPVTTTPTG